jgi:hypothetical protein
MIKKLQTDAGLLYKSGRTEKACVGFDGLPGVPNYCQN